MRGSVRVHMVYSVRAKLAVRITARFPDLLAVGHGEGAAILTTGLAWFALGLAIALARDLSLADYLIKIFLPSSPGLLDCTELARSHWRHATLRENAQHDMQDIWDATGTTPPGSTLPHAATSRTPPTCYAATDHASRHSYKLRRAATHAAISAGVTELRAGPDDD
jgi:hypothetical protein